MSLDAARLRHAYAHAVAFAVALAVALALPACDKLFGGETESSSETRAVDVDADAGDATVTDKITGPAGDPANMHIPDMEPPAANLSEFVAQGDVMFISFNEIGLVLNDSTTVEEANALLAGIDGTLIGTITEASILLIKVPTHDLDGVTAVLSALNADPRVDLALSEIIDSPAALPPSNHVPRIWTWARSDYLVVPPVEATDGNWGLEMIRAPAMWNLDTFVARHRSAVNVSAGVIDNGYSPLHTDLGRLRVVTGARNLDHGTMVAGIIGATYDNRAGAEGVDPWITSIDGQIMPGYLRSLRRLGVMLRDDPNLRVVNNSYGWGVIFTIGDQTDDGLRNGSFKPAVVAYGDINGDGDHADTFSLGTSTYVEWPPIDGDHDGHDDSWSRVMHHYGNLYRRGAGTIAAKLMREDFIFVVAAGNAGPHYQAEDSHPLAAAAQHGDQHFISVMSVSAGNHLSDFSQVGGTVAAPGECVTSTEADDGSQVDGGCAWADPSRLYGTASGTSFAAPHVAGLIAALWKLEPSLTYKEMHRLVTDAEFTVYVGLDKRIDAFNSAMGIDVVKGNLALQTALVDVDDGTTDGNRRTRRDENDAVESEDDRLYTSDGRRGDGKISMADFRAFRDAVVQAGLEGGTLTAADTFVDGADNHPKKDLNGDGCVGTNIVPGGTWPCVNAPGEDIYSRFDFNGDGKVDLTSKAKLKGEDKTDLEVLMDVWPTDPELNEGWPASALPSLIPDPAASSPGSGDIDFRPRDLLGSAYDEIRITIDQGTTAVTRSITLATDPNTPRLVWTVPSRVTTRFTAEGWKGGARVDDVCRPNGLPLEISDLKHGQDKVLRLVSCAGGPVVQWTGTSATSASTRYFNVDAMGQPVGDRVNLSQPQEILPLSGARTCASLAIGDTCAVSETVDSAHASHQVSFSISRPMANVYEITGSLTSQASQIDFIEPPGASGTFCGDLNARHATECRSESASTIAVFINIPIRIEGTHNIKYECQATGDFLPHPETFRYSQTNIFDVDSNGVLGGPVVACESPDPAATSWTVDATSSGMAATFDTFGRIDIGAYVNADAGKFHLDPGYSYADTVLLNITRIRITIE